MTRALGGVLFVAAALVGCNNRHDLLSREDTQNRQHLTNEQQQEREDLRREQANERERAAEHARNDLPDQTRETTRDRQETAQDVARLDALVQRACQGIAMQEQEACPVSHRNVQSVNDLRNGVEIRMTSSANDKNGVQQRLDCYRARAELHADSRGISPNEARTEAATTRDRTLGERLRGSETTATPPPTTGAVCVVDLPDVDVDVNDHDGHVVLDLTSSSDTRVSELRAKAYQLMTPPPATTDRTRANDRDRRDRDRSNDRNRDRESRNHR